MGVFKHMRLFVLLFVSLMMACSKPIDTLLPLRRIAIVSVKYDPNIYKFQPSGGVSNDVYAAFSNQPDHAQLHEHMLNEFLVDLMTDTVKKSNLSIVRPLNLLNTTLMHESGTLICYEYLLNPYDPIDIRNRPFMAGLAKKLLVDAVVEIKISFAVHLDEKMLWEEYNDPYAKTLNSYRMQVQHGHETSQLRTTVELHVVNQLGDVIYHESRFVDTNSDQISVSDTDLSFDGGVSPKLLRLGLDRWMHDWVSYLPEYKEN